MERSGVRPSVRPLVPSIDSSNGGRRVCCWASTTVADIVRRAAGAGAQQQMRVESRRMRLENGKGSPYSITERKIPS